MGFRRSGAAAPSGSGSGAAGLVPNPPLLRHRFRVASGLWKNPADRSALRARRSGFFSGLPGAVSGAGRLPGASLPPSGTRALAPGPPPRGAGEPPPVRSADDQRDRPAPVGADEGAGPTGRGVGAGRLIRPGGELDAPGPAGEPVPVASPGAWVGISTRSTGRGDPGSEIRTRGSHSHGRGPVPPPVACPQGRFT